MKAKTDRKSAPLRCGYRQQLQFGRRPPLKSAPPARFPSFDEWKRRRQRRRDWACGAFILAVVLVLTWEILPAFLDGRVAAVVGGK